MQNGGSEVDIVKKLMGEVKVVAKHSKLDAIDENNFFVQLITSWNKSDVIKGDGKVQSRRLVIAGEDFFVKRYCFYGNISMWLYKQGVHKYSRMLKAMQTMAISGISTPAVYRIVIDKSSKRLFTISAYEASGKDLRYLIGRDLDKIFSERLLVEQTAMIMARLHDRACVLHGDFKWANILLDHKNNKLALVDLDSARKLNAQSKCFYRDVARFVIDCDEAGLSQDNIDKFIKLYGRFRGKGVSEIHSSISVDYRKFKVRHVKKYGEGFKLANPGKADLT